jgi:hypothetical protein
MLIALIEGLIRNFRTADRLKESLYALTFYGILLVILAEENHEKPQDNRTPYRDDTPINIC